MMKFQIKVVVRLDKALNLPQDFTPAEGEVYLSEETLYLVYQMLSDQYPGRLSPS